MFKKFLSLSLIALSFAACTEDVMDDINKDEANPAVDIVDAKFQITDAIMSTAYSTYGGAYAWYVSSYTEQVFGTGDNQLRKAELRNSNETAASTTFNNEWNATYTNLMNIKQILDKTGKGKINEGHNDVAGIANVLWVLNFEALTDLHGDIPYSQALQGFDNMQPDLDSQLDIYADLLKRIEDAIKAFDMAIANEESNVGSQDILYGGDCEKWKALAYAVKARLLLNAPVFIGEDHYDECEKLSKEIINVCRQTGNYAIQRRVHSRYEKRPGAYKLFCFRLTCPYSRHRAAGKLFHKPRSFAHKLHAFSLTENRSRAGCDKFTETMTQHSARRYAPFLPELMQAYSQSINGKLSILRKRQLFFIISEHYAKRLTVEKIS